MVDDVVVGNVLQPGAGAATARMAALSAGIKVPHFHNTSTTLPSNSGRTVVAQ